MDDKILQLIMTRKGLGIKKPVVSKKSQYDTKRFQDEMEDNIRMVQQASVYWYQLSDMRKRANRTFDYYTGNQWCEMIAWTDDNGQAMYTTESAYIIAQGRIPFVQNIMLATGNNIKGQYMSAPMQCIVMSRDRNDQQRSTMLSAALKETLDINQINKLDPYQIEGYINCGVIMERTSWSYFPEKNRPDGRIIPVNYNNAFFNNFSDIRATDINFIGEIIDTTIDELVSAFAKNEADAEYIKSKYPGSSNKLPRNSGVTQTGSGDELKRVSFEIPQDSTVCRIYSIWEKRSEWRTREHDRLRGTHTVTKRTLAQVEAENNERLNTALANGVEPGIHLFIEAVRGLEEFWFFKFLTPFYDCLAFGESPYEHESHPYILTVNMLNGKIWSFNETMIDSQRQVNRLLSLNDALLGGAAKNTYVADEEAFSGEHSTDEADARKELSKINGFIKVKRKIGDTGNPLQHLQTSSQSLGINDMVSGYIQMILKLSGISDASRGERPAAGTPAALYQSQVQQSQLNILHVFTAINNHLKDRSTKLLSIIRQYKEDSILRSTRNQKEALMYKRDEARAVKDIDMQISQTMDTPLMRQVGEDVLTSWIDKGFITLLQALQFSSLPFADELKEELEKNMQESGGQVTPEMMQSLQGAKQQLPQDGYSEPVMQN